MQLSFEDRESLEPQDRRILKEADLSFRGKNAWPLFRSYRPGFVPWFLESEEAETLRVALEQLLAVALRIRIDPAITRPADLLSYLMTEVLGIELRVHPRLKKLDPAKKGLFAYLAEGR